MEKNTFAKALLGISTLLFVLSFILRWVAMTENQMNDWLYRELFDTAYCLLCFVIAIIIIQVIYSHFCKKARKERELVIKKLEADIAKLDKENKEDNTNADTKSDTKADTKSILMFHEERLALIKAFGLSASKATVINTSSQEMEKCLKMLGDMQNPYK